MRPTTETFKQVMASGNARKYQINVNMTLADSTSLTLTEEDIWSDSFSIETASSGTSSFDLGTAVIGKCKFSINNFDERFSQYDFFNATAIVWVKLVGDSTYYRMGFFTVDEPVYASSLISLELLDNMWKFDVPLSSVTITYPITIRNALLAICSYCGVSLATQSFHGYNFTLSTAPEKDMNCREFIQYCAMIGCNFCTINATGALELKWYNTSAIPSGSDLDGGSFRTSTTPYSDGDSADGGTFAFNDGDSYDGGTFTDNSDCVWFTRNMQASFGTDVITITGVKFIIKETAYSIGSAGYVLELENPLVDASNVNSVLNLIWDVLEGFTLRTFNLTTASDLSAEIGDCCILRDYKGNNIYSWITLNTFKFANHVVQCNAVSPTRTLEKRYSKTVSAAVDATRKQTEEIISDYDLAVQLMNDVAVNAMGGYEDYEDLPTGGRVYYLSNMPITKSASGTCSFQSGSTVFKRTGDGLFVSTNGGQTWQNGYNPSTGQLVVNVLNAIGVSADWIKTGTLDAALITAGRIRDRYNYNYWDLDTGELKISALPAGQSISDPTSPNQGAYVPTNSNLPASNWTTDEQKKQHVGETFYNTSSKKTYIYKSIPGEGLPETAHPYANNDDKYYHFVTSLTSPVYLLFENRIETESNYDYIRIYESDGSGGYKMSNQIMGTISSGSYIPVAYEIDRNEFWLTWHTDSSVQNYGWKITDIQGSGYAEMTLDLTWTSASLPSATWTDITYPATNSYQWVEASLEEYVGAKAESSQTDLTQEEIFDILTDHQQNQGLFLSGNKLYINGEMFATNALMIGKNPNTGYEPYLQIFANDGTTEIGRWDKNGIEANAGKFGKLHVFTDSGNNQTYLRYVTTKTYKYIDKSWSAGTNSKGTGYFAVNPYKEGWTEDGYVDFNFYRNVTGSTTQCTVTVYRYTNGTRGFVKTNQLRGDGNTSGGVKGLNNVLLDHTVGENDGDYYWIKYTLTSSTKATTLEANDGGKGSSFVIRENGSAEATCIGKFLGEFKGQGTFNTLDLGCFKYNDGDKSSGFFTIDNNSGNNYGELSWSQFSLSDTPDFNDCYTGLRIQKDDLSQVHEGNWRTVEWVGSDRRIKNDIQPIPIDLSVRLIDGTETKSFKYKNATVRTYGMIAQEARELLDSLGETDTDLEYSMGNTNIPDQRNINYTQYIPHLINYVKDLRSEIDNLKAEIKELKGE